MLMGSISADFPRGSRGTLWQLDLCEFRQKMVVSECEKKLMGLTHVDLPG